MLCDFHDKSRPTPIGGVTCRAGRHEKPTPGRWPPARRWLARFDSPALMGRDVEYQKSANFSAVFIYESKAELLILAKSGTFDGDHRTSNSHLLQANIRLGGRECGFTPSPALLGIAD